MRSIRLSLVVYFLFLIAGALGVVSWLVYQTVAATLQRKDNAAAKLIQEQYENTVANYNNVLDRRLVRQGQAMASMARMTSLHYEALYPLGVLSAVLAPQGHLLVPLWVGEGYHVGLTTHLSRTRPIDIIFDSAEDVLQGEGGSQEYYRAYRRNGYPLACSHAIDDPVFTLEDDNIHELETAKETFDHVTLSSGKKLRRVTFRASVSRYVAREFYFPYRFTRAVGFFAPPMRRAGDRIFNPPQIYLQYASDISGLEKQIFDLRKQRDDRFASMGQESRNTLAALRERLLLIGLACFVAIFVGGFFLVRLGLAPLQRLSDAVSQVSEKDFTLKIKPEQMPEELEPIVSRLTATLADLKKAFAHEKRATADFSHELRTPLAALLTTLEVALRKHRSPEEYREMLAECRDSTQHLLFLAERMLILARLDAAAERINMLPCDLSQLAHQCAEMVRPLAEKSGLQLQVHAPPTLPTQTDPQKIRELLTNLLHNAIEYNRTDGCIDLSVKRLSGQVILEVQDTGIGIPLKAKDHLFERFFRADPSRHSDTPHAGLGLSIVKGCIDLLGGRIEVHSTPEQGSTFRVHLPYQESLPRHPNSEIQKAHGGH